MIQALQSAGAHLVALAVYPGLAIMLAFGGLVELAWTRLGVRDTPLPSLPRRRPGPVVITVAVCGMLASVQAAAPLSPMPAEERSVVLAAAALLFTAWAELALTDEHAAEPRLLLLVQACWLLAVLGPAVQPESLRPQVLGNVQVPGLLPVKAACALLYLLCLPALLRLWPVGGAKPERRVGPRLDAVRILCWFPYCALFTTLFVPPAPDDLLGVLRFLAVTVGVAFVVGISSAVLRRQRPSATRSLYTRAVAPYAVLVLGAVIVTSALLR